MAERVTSRPETCVVPLPVQPDGAFRNHKYVVWSNVVVGGVCFLMLTKTLYCVVWRVWRSLRLGMRWCALTSHLQCTAYSKDAPNV